MPLSIHKMLLYSYEEDTAQSIFFLMIFVGITLKLENVDLSFSIFNPCPP